MQPFLLDENPKICLVAAGRWGATSPAAVRELYLEKFVRGTGSRQTVISNVAPHLGASITNATLRATAARQSPARTVLRTATHDIHERLHRHPALSQLAAGTIERDEYRCVLARSYGFYAMVEPVFGLATNLTECLVKDLTELGMTPAAIDDLPRCAPFSLGQGEAELIGARYVLLGASLGGKIMARAMAGRTDGHAALPVHFLTGTGENEWKTFAADLEMNLPDAALRTRAAKAATATFAAYEKWMTVYE